MTHPRWPAKRIFGAMAAPLVIAGVLTGSGPAGASALSCQNWTGVPPPSPGTSDNVLKGVIALSACNAWAVGFDTSGSAANQTLIEHWDGSAWKVVPSPDPGSIDNVLYGVHAVSATSIWAVGNYADAAGDNTLVLRWNGTAWKQVPSPGLGDLFAVDAVSAHDARAVGETANQTHNQTLILRWNGTRWKRVPSPNAGSGDFLTGVAATSTSSAWAVGADGTSGGTQTLVLRWNGRKWARVTSPSPGTSNELFGIGATSAASAWAVGTSGNSARRHTLILRWNGRKWARVTSPSPGAPDNVLNGVTVTSASNAWAVGDSFGASPESKTLILHWNGRTWQRVASPDTVDASDKLWAVAATSARNAWVVGASSSSTQALALHCC